MPIVTWRDEYRVNVAVIDAQHQEMLDRVNKLHASVEARVEKPVLEEMLVELVKFTRSHFLTEEKLMKEHEYPNLPFHYKEHRMLLQHMDYLVKNVSSGKYPTFFSDYDASSDWALDHISNCDKALGAFLNSKGVY